jgi:hypothetical protein
MHTAGPATPTSSPAFVPLGQHRARPALRSGCLTRLSGLLVAFGLWLAAFSLLIRPEAPYARLQVGAGVAIAGSGALLLLRMLRRIRASAASRVELALPAGAVLCPGVSVPLRVRLTGPARVDRLVVRVVCERHYTRQVMTPGATAVSTTSGVEVLWRQDLLDERDLVAPTRLPVDRLTTLVVSTLARPTGPIMPSGTAVWRLEVGAGPEATTAGTYDIVVAASAEAAAAAPTAAPPSRGRSARPFTSADLSTGLGCVAIALGFLVVGPVFLWLYFSGTATKRGNPVMGLVAGIVFTSLGLLALFALVKGLVGRDPPNRSGRQGGRPLP